MTVGRLHSEKDRRGKRKQSEIVDTRVFPISEREFSPMGFASLFSLWSSSLNIYTLQQNHSLQVGLRLKRTEFLHKSLSEALFVISEWDSSLSLPCFLVTNHVTNEASNPFLRFLFWVAFENIWGPYVKRGPLEIETSHLIAAQKSAPQLNSCWPIFKRSAFSCIPLPQDIVFVRGPHL